MTSAPSGEQMPSTSEEGRQLIQKVPPILRAVTIRDFLIDFGLRVSADAIRCGQGGLDMNRYLGSTVAVVRQVLDVAQRQRNFGLRSLRAEFRLRICIVVYHQLVFIVRVHVKRKIT